MTGNNSENEYQANEAESLVGELFSGGMTVADAIERLRSRLLDLSARNQLLNYRHPKGRCIQIVDSSSLSLVFNRLCVAGNGVPFKYVPEPLPDSYVGKRPEAKIHAESIGISNSLEFAPSRGGSTGHRLQAVQALLYPEDLERQLRKISTEAKTAIEETGSNILFLIFGFLEFYDSEDSERPMLAPLLALPVALVRGAVDSNTGTYHYTVQHNGEDLAENHTLREKMRRDFMLSLPEFGEEDEPETYFASIEQTINNKRRWRVRRQITLGMLSFGKLAIWADLDTQKNELLPNHELIKLVFSGGSWGGAAGLHAEDYRIDQRLEAAQPLIYDADSSQHSALIDVLEGKNLVINGPPGTGKSQTITNIIAAALSKGKKVLFVSEKLAALEVVRHRLDHAGLGHFCLELHSHKTQKKKFLEDIQARIDQRFPAPEQLQAKLATLNRQKGELARYAELMGSRVSSSLGLTVNEVFWAAERRRQALGDLSATVSAVNCPDTSEWTQDDIERRRTRLDSLANLYVTVERFDSNHPWWGFRPLPLAPTDDETIGRIIYEALEWAQKANAAANVAVKFFKLNGQPETLSTAKVRLVLDQAPDFPEGADPSLIERMFDAKSDPEGVLSSKVLAQVASGVIESRRLLHSASRVLADGQRLPSEKFDELRRLAEKRKFASNILKVEIDEALRRVSRLEKALGVLTSNTSVATPPYGPAGNIEVDAFIQNLNKTPASKLGEFPIRSIAKRASAVLQTVTALSESISKISAIATRRGLTFDTTPVSVARLAGADGIPGLTKGLTVDAKTLSEARRLAAFPLSDQPISKIQRLKDLLEVEKLACSDALVSFRLAADRLGISFNSSERAVEELSILATIAAAAPIDLLEYRRPTLGLARSTELIENIRLALASNKANWEKFDPVFYLDTLPGPTEIKLAVAALRYKDGFFAFFDGEWRKGRKLHIGLCREKREVSSKERAEELGKLLSWVEARDSFVSDPEFKEYFGSLFRGLETDPEKIARLNDWYRSGQAALMRCPGLTEKINLTTIPAERLLDLAAKAESVGIGARRLAKVESAVRELLGANASGFLSAKAVGWDSALAYLDKAGEVLGSVAGFFSVRAESVLSPRDALRLMEARADFDGIASEFTLVMRGDRAIQEAGGEELGSLANLTGDRWIDVLKAISSQATLAAETAKQALAFAVDTSTLSAAHKFAEAKAELDVAWSNVASPPVWNSVTSWTALADIAREDASVARKIFELVAPFARNGVSATEYFEASSQEEAGNTTLAQLAKSDQVNKLLGNQFQGVNTNLDRLSRIHQWGAGLTALDLTAEVRSRLRTKDAPAALPTARRLYREIDDGCRKAREAVESLASYGSIVWDDWQKQGCPLSLGRTRAEGAALHNPLR